MRQKKFKTLAEYRDANNRRVLAWNAKNKDRLQAIRYRAAKKFVARYEAQLAAGIVPNTNEKEMQNEDTSDI